MTPRNCIAAILICTLVTLATGEQPPVPAGNAPGAPGAATSRPASPRPFPRRISPMDPTGLLHVMKEQLGLDQTQEAAVQQLLEGHRAQVEEVRKSLTPPPETADATRDILTKMRDAQAKGDHALVRQYTDELRKLREETNSRIGPMRERFEQLQTQLHDKLAGLLRDEQKAGFERIWEERMIRTPPRPAAQNTRLLRMLVDRLSDLSSDQKQKMQDLNKQYTDAMKEAGRDPGARERAEQAYHDAVMALLLPAQKSEIERQMEQRRPRRSAPDHPEGTPPPQPPGGGTP